MSTRISYLLQNPFEVGTNDIALLQDEIEKYPYFSTLRTLLLFGLKEFDHSTYQEELKKTSIHSPSRVALYHYLQREKQESKEPLLEINQAEEMEEIVVVDTREEILEKEVSLAQEVIEIPEIETKEVESTPELENEEKTPNNESAHTFSEWLSLSKSNSIESVKAPSEKDIKFQLIDEFIEKSPKISPVNKSVENLPPPKKSELSTEYSDLMTETLAQIYTEQKKYDKATKAYKILSLKYPEKREFFEDKISEIENLQKL